MILMIIIKIIVRSSPSPRIAVYIKSANAIN